jgi:hypothetical protein
LMMAAMSPKDIRSEVEHRLNARLLASRCAMISFARNFDRGHE